MPLVLNGTGTITGLQAGGLPDATVLTADIADGAITPAKTAVGALPSMVRVSQSPGNGSTNTAIRRFTTVRTNQGSDITYADSATLGGLFTINTNGVYAVSYSDSINGISACGVSLNSTALSTTLESIPPAEVLIGGVIAAANIIGIPAWTGYLPAGSLIRAHTSAGAGVGAYTALINFTITRVA